MSRYEAVADHIRGLINNGTYPPGTQLPPRAQMRYMYNISDTVCDKVMMLLRREGLTETLPGVGVYVKEAP